MVPVICHVYRKKQSRYIIKSLLVTVKIWGEPTSSILNKRLESGDSTNKLDLGTVGFNDGIHLCFIIFIFPSIYGSIHLSTNLYANRYID